MSLLVADFQAFSDAPCLSKLLAEQAGSARPVFQVDPVGVISAAQAYLPVAELAAGAAAEFLAAGTAGQVTVIGHCSASGLALRIGRLLAADRDVSVLLVQPTWPDDEHVRIRFGEYLANVKGGDRPCPDTSGDPVTCLAEMEQVLRDALIGLARSMGLGSSAEPFLDLLTWYRAWLSFLLACRNDRPDDGDDAGWPGGLAAVQVLTDAASAVEVPWIGASRWQRRQVLGPGQGATATPELAGVVLSMIAGGCRR